MLKRIKYIVWPTLLIAANAFAADSINYQVIEKNNHQIHLLEFDPTVYKMISVRADGDLQKSPVSEIVKENGAIAGINGGFFHLDKQGRATPAGALKIRDQWLGFAKIPRGAIGWNELNSKALVDRIVTKRGKKQIVEVIPQIDNSQTSQKVWQNFSYVVGGVGLLLKNGQAIVNHANEKALASFWHERHARTAICIKDAHHWMFVVSAHTKIPYREYTDQISEGLTLKELTHFLQEQGCKEAINLDGGGSSTLVYENKVRNTPAGDMDDIFHLFHERPVHDAILLMPK